MSVLLTVIRTELPTLVSAIFIMLVMVVLLITFPGLALWLPEVINPK